MEDKPDKPKQSSTRNVELPSASLYAAGIPYPLHKETLTKLLGDKHRLTKWVQNRDGFLTAARTGGAAHIVADSITASKALCLVAKFALANGLGARAVNVSDFARWFTTEEQERKMAVQQNTAVLVIDGLFQHGGHAPADSAGLSAMEWFLRDWLGAGLFLAFTGNADVAGNMPRHWTPGFRNVLRDSLKFAQPV